MPQEGLVYDYRFDHGGVLALSHDEDENEEEVVKEKKVISINIFSMRLKNMF